jgi:hypothetical protein
VRRTKPSTSIIPSPIFCCGIACRFPLTNPACFAYGIRPLHVIDKKYLDHAYCLGITYNDVCEPFGERSWGAVWLVKCFAGKKNKLYFVIIFRILPRSWFSHTTSYAHEGFSQTDLIFFYKSFSFILYDRHQTA